MEEKLQLVYNLTLDGRQWLASCSSTFFLPRKRLCAHWLGGRMNFRSFLDVVVERKIPVSLPDVKL
jgi:hypothetical protein